MAGVNKVVYGNNVEFDISDSTVSPNNLLGGNIAYSRSGDRIVGALDGSGCIIVDTSALSVGDVVRVRSMTDSQVIFTEEVETVGDFIKFTVPCYDYYKICLVQEVDNEEFEIGGVYKTVDFGQTIFVNNIFDKSTLRGIQGILDSHNENQLNIGDSVFIDIQGGNKWETLIGAINPYSSHEILLVSKYLYDSTFTFDPNNHTSKRNAETVFYNSISTDDKLFLKDKQVNAGAYPGTSTSFVYTAKVWSPTSFELCGINVNQGDYEKNNNVQFAIFASQSNRIKLVDGGSNTAIYATSSDSVRWAALQLLYINTTGDLGASTSLSNCRILPCFRLTADV